MPTSKGWGGQQEQPLGDQLRQPGAVLEFARDANGTAPPKRVISGSNTPIECTGGNAVDRKSADIYVADYRARTVLVFGPDAPGNTAPVQRLSPGFDFGVAVH